MEQPHIFGPTFSTFVRSVMLCCEEKGIDYSVGLTLNGEEVPFKSEGHFGLHPYGKVPVLVLGEHRLFESASICRYLDEIFPGADLQPSDPWQRARVDQLCAEVSGYVYQALVVGLLLEFAFPKGEGGAVRLDKVEQALPEAVRIIERLEDVLGGNAFIAGNSYTIADALLIPILDYLVRLPVADRVLSADSGLRRYIQRIQSRPASQSVLTHR
ncbi:glutathione S-transferase family protein [Marinobacterium litorale]|uniref:glutathione S-transferase family protein n=1 Tax=Marinobacterium litorale TaxID=404770 RepID=UPI0003F7C9CD|nr:glutathione S-transferase family protein [Marinobacterium litorale]